MKKIEIFLILLIFFISIGAVYADGNFSSLQKEIEAANTSIEITQDYRFDNVSDSNLNNGILINKSNDFTVNGNGHTIDGAGQARIFNTTGSVTIMNLKLINGFSKDNGGAIINNERIVLRNVTFENNYAKEGGAVNCDLIEANNCVFDKNYAEKGGAIKFKFHSIIWNSIFKNSNNLNYSVIYGNSEQTGIRFENCIFTNITSKFAGVIFNRINTVFVNSSFTNIHSEESGGAIIVKEMKRLDIKDCTFINVTSVKNGGAIYVDAMGSSGLPSETLIENTKFINSNGNFGAALLQLGGNLTINNAQFIENEATFDGGAIYASNVIANLDNITFISNRLLNNEFNGGAAFFDKSNINIINSNFKDNSKNGIFAYDSTLTIEKSNFKDNGEAVHGVFSKYEMKEVNLNNDTLNLNNTDYLTLIIKNKTDITLINSSIDVVNLPKRFDSRQWGWVSSIKNQIEDGTCWSFGTIAALESALLKSTGIEYDFSENNIKNTMLQYSRYGILDIIESGYARYATENLLSWLGPVLEEYEPYDVLGKVSLINLTGTNIHVQDAIFVGPRKNLTDNDEIKKAIMKCGSLAIEYYAAADSPDYNSKTHAQYQDLSNDATHVVSVVGWDDTYPKENFLTTPPGDGAWILKDNFGIKEGDGGYIYLSYYDISFLNTTYAVGFIFENLENYTKNYQRDLSGEISFINSTDGKDVSYKITYQSKDNDLISGVGTYFKNKGEYYTLNIYVNNQLKHTQNGTAPYFGFHTVKLTDEIPIKNGDNFTVEMTKKTVPILNKSRQHYETNTTFINDGNGWKDLTLDNRTTSLKVYTKCLDIYTQDLVKIYKNESRFNAFIGQANKTVSFEVNGVTYNRTSKADGKASLAINLMPGNYTIKTTFNGITIENNIEVLPTLLAGNLVKYFRNESQFLISLIDGEGNPVSGVNITMNIHGVFYNRLTKENGTAKLNINLEPGEYILTAQDPLTGLQMSYTITVLPVLTAKDLNMSYKDGSKFEAKLVNGKGNPLANVSITFNVNGIFYNRTTNSDGIAKLNINLMPGEYIITSKYDYAVVSNKITIRG